MNNKPWIPWVAIGLAMILVGGGIGRWIMVAQILMALGTVALVIGAVVFGTPFLQRSRDPYDLGKLQQIHDQLEFKEAEATTVEVDAEIVCPSCFEPYSSNLPSCPRCGRIA